MLFSVLRHCFSWFGGCNYRKVDMRVVKEVSSLGRKLRWRPTQLFDVNYFCRPVASIFELT